MKNDIEINDIEDLLGLIDNYFEVNKSMVIKVAEVFLKCVYISFNHDTKDTFKDKVIKHYEFSKNKKKKDRPLILTSEPKNFKEFKISDIIF